MDSLLGDHRRRGIVWDTDNKVVHFDIQKDSIGVNKKIVLHQDLNGKVEMRVCTTEELYKHC